MSEKTINKQNLIDALTKVKPGLANKEIVEQSTYFIFDDDKIWTYNDQVSVSQNFESGLIGAVKSEGFYKLLNKIPDEEIIVSQEKGLIKILAGKKRSIDYKIDPEVKITPMDIPGINSKKWEKLPENFGDAIAFSAFSASRNLIRPELTCLYVVDDMVIGCDTYRGTKYKLKSKMEQTFLLPATAAIELAKYNPYKVICEEGWLHFVNKEKTIFSCRTYDIIYPEQIWSFFEIEGDEIVLPEGFIDTIDRAQVLITTDFDLDRIVSLTIEDNRITCEGSGDFGKIKEWTDIEYSGEKIDIKVHPVLLSEILKHLQTIVIGERLLFKGIEFEHAICLSNNK